MKTWLITGTSTGLGRLLCEQLLERGDRVIATLRKQGALDDLLALHGDRLQILTLDVTDTAAIIAVVSQAFEAAGRIDVIVSNAGYGLFGAAEEASPEQIERQLATNLTGSIHLIRAVLPHLRAQGGGRIVQVSSEGGQIAYPGFSLYHATKWGIEGSSPWPRRLRRSRSISSSSSLAPPPPISPKGWIAPRPWPVMKPPRLERSAGHWPRVPSPSRATQAKPSRP